VLPGYEILDKLGEGASGVVYKARQLSLNRFVAVKVLRSERQGRGNALARFRREAQAAARVLHPNVVLIYEAEQVGDAFVLIMEYVDGIDLGQAVKKYDPLPVSRVCDYVRQAALGLQHAHEHGLIHRDIKPGNLMLALSEGEIEAETAALSPTGTIKILDFGLVRLSQPQRRKGAASSLTHEGDFLGTPDFMAPEQARNPRRVDGRADLYSLGCTFYFLLTGRTPFEATTVSEKLYKHWTAEPTPITVLRSEVPPAIANVVHRLIAKNPQDRYQTAAALIDVLDAWLAPSGPATVDASVPSGVPPARLPGNGTMAPTVKGPSNSGSSVELVCRLEGHLDWVHAVALSPDGRQALSASRDHTTRLWDLASSREVRCFSGHHAPVRTVAFSPNGRYAVSAGEDRTVRVWDLDSGWEVRCLTGHTDFVTSVAFLPDGQHVLSGGHDRTMRLWAVGSGREVACLAGQPGRINALALTADGRHVFSGGENRTVHVWDLRSNREVQRLALHPREELSPVVTSLAVTPDGSRLIAGGSDHAVYLLDVTHGRRLACLTGHTGWIGCVALSPDGHRGVSGAGDRTVRLWDVETKRELCCLEMEADSAVFSADGQRILLGGRDKTVSVWSLQEA
jgi:WD40 repeat protein/tRNA A-37 threonylcarbamoyl transferase component Bud32